MFNSFKQNNNTNMATPQQQSSGSMYNSLTAGSKIIGTVIADSDIRIDGTIEGEVKCNGKVIIGEQGYIKGNIVCQNSDVQGKLEGKIEVKQTLALRSTAKIQAEVNTQVLIVEPNAVFNGTCVMGKPQASAIPQQPQQQTK
jgi:cytoskeletal protein CcmA (bactofilin family)